ncbi:hypothetical protein HK104_004944 [Borealophlyctis nickersoniae]|nr:hypothetical protein HK104_004944 [Borealophlyctis nickersoniae]
MPDAERINAEKARNIASALKEGRLPTTEQAVNALSSLKKSGALQNAAKDMSLEGKKVMVDAEQLLDDTRKTLQAKIPNNELQNIIYHSTQAAQEAAHPARAATQAAKVGMKRAGEELEDVTGQARQEAQEAVGKAAHLAKMIVTSRDFRDLLNDVSGILQDVLRNNVQDATEEITSNKELPESVRNAAKSTNEAVQKGNVVDKAKEKGSEAVKKGKSKASEMAEEAKEKGSEAAESAKQAKNKAEETAKKGAKAAKDTAEHTAQETGQAVSQRRSLRNTAKTAVDAVADKAEEHIPPETVDKISSTVRNGGAKLARGEGVSTDKIAESAKQAKSKAKDVAVDVGKQAKDKIGKAKEIAEELTESGGKAMEKLADLPEDKKNEIIERFKKVSEKIRNNPDFKSAIDDMFTLVSDLRDRASGVAEMVVDETQQAKDETMEAVDEVKSHFAKKARVAALSGKQLIENFACGRSLDNLIQAVQEVAEKVATDDSLADYFTSLTSFLNSSFTDTSFPDASTFTSTATTLISGARDAFSRYTRPILRLTYETTSYAAALAADPGAQKLKQDADALVRDLFLDEKGRPAFKGRVLADLAKCVPVLADKLAYLPIPRMEMDDGEYQFVLDNIVLHSTIFPKYVRVVTDTTIDVTDGESDLESSVELEISHIEASARDVAWLYNKHSGFFRVGDVGYADFDLKNEGLSIRLRLVPGLKTGGTPTEGGRMFHVDDVDVQVHDLSLRLHDSGNETNLTQLPSHILSWLYKILQPLITSRAKTAIQDAIASGLKTILFRLDEEVANVATRIGATTEEPVRTVKGGVPPEWGSDAFDV